MAYDFYTQARKNMVDTQLMPGGITDNLILQAFSTIPREEFLPNSQKTIAYTDHDIPLDGGRFVLSPLVHAKLIQALSLTPEDSVLDIACATGYSSAILSQIVETVVGLTQYDEVSQIARENCEKLSLYNIAFFSGDLIECCAQHGPYKAIIFNGAIPSMPDDVFDKLENNGRLVYIERKAGSHMGQAILVQKSANGTASKQILFDAATPYLPGQAPKDVFVF